MKNISVTVGTLVISLLATCANIAHAVDATLTDDSYISSGPNNGSKPKLVLNMAKSQIPFLKFDLSTLPAGTQASGVAKATLTLWPNAVTTADTVKIERVDSVWDESTLQTMSQSSTDIGITMAVGTKKKFVTADVTALVKDWIDNTVPNNGIALFGTSAASMKFDSKENGGTGHAPRLEITLREVRMEGVANTAIGYQALASNDDGFSNTAVGYRALESNVDGNQNTAFGVDALQHNIGGNFNTAIGFGALGNLDGGWFNIALGIYAGDNRTTGDYNIDLFNRGVAAESSTIRIGDSNFQTRVFIAGIRGVTTGAANAVPVVIDSNGQLGTISSSRRFKTDIRNMGDVSSKLMQLRPVTFHYKKDLDPSGTLQYGLVAEEVEKVFPDLVAYDKDGKIETVKYHLLASLLLNEMQKQHAQIAKVRAENAALRAQVQEIEAVKARLANLEAGLPITTARGNIPTRP